MDVLHQRLDIIALMIASDIRMQIPPESLDRVVVRAVRRQEDQIQSLPFVRIEADFNLTTGMNAVVVEDHVNGACIRVPLCKLPQH